MDFDNLTPVAEQNTERITDYWPGKAADRKEGMTVVGEYVGSITFDEGTEDETTLYKLKKGDQIFGVQGYSPITRAFQDISVGTQVGIRFNGKKKSQKSSYFYNDFEVRISEEAAKTNQVKAVTGGEELPKDQLEDLPFN